MQEDRLKIGPRQKRRRSAREKCFFFCKFTKTDMLFYKYGDGTVILTKDSALLELRGHLC
jgi:hypothetical protein